MSHGKPFTAECSHMCRFKLLRTVNVFEHFVHGNSWPCLCRFSCAMRLVSLVNLRQQYRHGNNKMFSCVFIWSMYWYLMEKSIEQMAHRNRVPRPWFCLCWFRPTMLVNTDVHSSQVKTISIASPALSSLCGSCFGVDSLWYFFRWSFNRRLCLKLLEHKWHANGITSLCTLACNFNVSFVAKRRPHTLHWYGFSCKCVDRCRPKLLKYANRIGHSSHSYGRSPKQIEKDKKKNEIRSKLLKSLRIVSIDYNLIRKS